MPYYITLTDGTPLVSINDKSVDNTTSLSLIGRGYVMFGQTLNTDLVRLLENGANIVPPSAPLTGQMWYDKSTDKMRVWSNGTWTAFATDTATAAAIGLVVNGDVTGSADLVAPGATLTLSLSDTGVSPGTYEKVYVDAQGRITSGAMLDTADIINALGFVPAHENGDASQNFAALALTATTVDAASGTFGVLSAGTFIVGTFEATNGSFNILQATTATVGSITGSTGDFTNGSFATIVADSSSLGNATAITPPAGDATTKVATTAFVQSAFNAQSITLAGDVTGTLSAGIIDTTLAPTGVAPGTYSQVTVDAAGRVTSGSPTSGASTGDFTKVTQVSATTVNTSLSAADFGSVVVLNGTYSGGVPTVYLPSAANAVVGGRVRFVAGSSAAALGSGDISAGIVTTSPNSLINIAGTTTASVALFAGDWLDVIWNGTNWTTSGSAVLRATNTVTWDVSAPPPNNITLFPGQRATITYSNVGKVSIPIACNVPTLTTRLYRVMCVVTSTSSTPSPYTLVPGASGIIGNYSTYSVLMSDQNVTALGTSNTQPTLTPFTFGGSLGGTTSFSDVLLPVSRVDYNYAGNGFSFPMYETQASGDTEFGSANAFLDMLICVDSGNPFVRLAGGIEGGTVSAYSRLSNTSGSSWQVLGALAASAGTISGFMTIEALN